MSALAELIRELDRIGASARLRDLVVRALAEAREDQRKRDAGERGGK